VSELPHSWIATSLGDVTVDSAQRVPAPDEQFQYVDIVSIDRLTKRITSPQLLWGRNAPSRARKEIMAGDVLVSMTRPNLNAVALVPPEFERQIASTGFDVLRPVGVEPRWLFYVVRAQSFTDRMSELVQGALYPAVRSKDVRGYVAPLASLNEQKRIADKLDALIARVDACCERLDRVPGILKRFRQAVLTAATSGKLTEEWREDQILDDWQTVSIEAVASEIFDGPFGSNLKSKDYSDAGVRVVRLENIGWLNFIADKETFIPQEKYDELRKHTLKAKDVLFSLLLGRIQAARATSEGAAGPKRRKGGRRPKISKRAEVLMLTRKDVRDTHLTMILKERGPLTAEALWSASQLDIDDFYDQLKDEEARGLLREKRGGTSNAPRMLEAA
jgi:type I restriction enzyme, S subunit